MAKCVYCGKEFDVTHARKVLGRKFGAGTYDEYCPEADQCEDCLWSEVSADYNTGAEVIRLMGPGNAPWE